WRDTLFASQKELIGKGFKANIIENHDEPRGASRYLPEHAVNEAGKKMLATTSILLRGLPFLYQGQEVGMTNCRRDDISEYDDINTIDQYQVALDAGYSKEEALGFCYENSRDNARTPMQWTDEVQAGFTTGTPWLSVNPNYRKINVAEQQKREDSVLNYYKKLIGLRKSDEYRETFTYGNFVPVYENVETVFGFLRESEAGDVRVLVAANFGTQPVTLQLPGQVDAALLSNMGNERVREAEAAGGMITLESCESIVLRLE
ncbi:MAG: glucohydrolase, partial [Lachnospiraceae bacterium]|nr:glucohydrolase [Lachnospiraceae bacterium]